MALDNESWYENEDEASDIFELNTEEKALVAALKEKGLDTETKETLGLYMEKIKNKIDHRTCVPMEADIRVMLKHAILYGEAGLLDDMGDVLDEAHTLIIQSTNSHSDFTEELTDTLLKHVNDIENRYFREKEEEDPLTQTYIN